MSNTTKVSVDNKNSIVVNKWANQKADNPHVHFTYNGIEFMGVFAYAPRQFSVPAVTIHIYSKTSGTVAGLAEEFMVSVRGVQVLHPSVDAIGLVARDDRFKLDSPLTLQWNRGTYVSWTPIHSEDLFSHEGEYEALISANEFESALVEWLQGLEFEVLSNENMGKIVVRDPRSPLTLFARLVHFFR